MRKGLERHLCGLVMCLALAGCSNSADKAAALTKLLEACEEGSTATLTYRAGTWGGHVEVSCTWEVEVDE